MEERSKTCIAEQPVILGEKISRFPTNRVCAIIYEDDIQFSLQIPLIGNTVLVQEIAASCTPYIVPSPTGEKKAITGLVYKESLVLTSIKQSGRLCIQFYSTGIWDSK